MKKYNDIQEALTRLLASQDKLESSIMRVLALNDEMENLLNLYRAAVKINVKMEGPEFGGCDVSALKRAWEADK